MHDVLRQRLMRHIESLPEEQLYQALDYIEFLSSKYARESTRAPTSLQRFGELLEDKMRGQGLTVRTIRGTLTAVGTADRMFSGLAEAGRSLIREVEEGVKTVVSTAASPPAGSLPAGEARDPSAPPPAGSGGADHRNP
ncbi:MAG TPA: DUF2281 domain-containing protein [Longimicrobiaceae bacterium]|nr:DUF2281 domain-containing protein [Longimicrobiaceae bacterium]